MVSGVMGGMWCRQQYLEDYFSEVVSSPSTDDVRINAIQSLGRMRSKTSIALLVPLLFSESREVAGCIRDALIEIGDLASLVRALDEHLQMCCSNEGDSVAEYVERVTDLVREWNKRRSGVYEQIMRITKDKCSLSLTFRPQDAAICILMAEVFANLADATMRVVAEELRNPNGNYLLAMSILGKVPLEQREGSIAVLGELLRHATEAVRREACFLLSESEINDAKVIKQLIKTAHYEADWNIRMAAYIAIGNGVGAIEQRDVLSLCVGLKDSEALVREQAAVSLGKLGSKAVVTVQELCRTLHSDTEERVGVAVAFAIGNIDPGMSGKKCLEAALTKPGLIQYAAAIALGAQITDIGKLKTILENARKCGDEEIRSRAAEVLGQMETNAAK